MYKAEVYVQGTWSSNGLRFATAREAVGYARHLAGRWTLVQDFRAALSTDPVTHEWDDAEGLGAVGEAKHLPPQRVTF